MTDTMKDLVERLRTKAAKWQLQCDEWIEQARSGGVDVTPETEAIMRASIEAEALSHIESLTASEARWKAMAEELAGDMEKIADGDAPMPAATFYFPDQRVSKHNRCEHGRWMYEGCSACIEIFARQSLTRFHEMQEDGER